MLFNSIYDEVNSCFIPKSLIPKFKLQIQPRKLQDGEILTSNPGNNQLLPVVVWCSKTVIMKKASIIPFLFLLATTSFCQRETMNTKATGADLLKKSKTQKTVAWVLAGTSAISFGKAFSDVLDEDIFSDEYQHSYGLSLGIGTASLAGSIILFVASGRNKRKAGTASAFIDMEQVPVFQGTFFTRRSFPVIGVKIKI